MSKPFPVLRVLGGCAVGLLAWVGFHRPLPAVLGPVVAVGLGVAAGRWFPRFVLRRLLWTVPLFLLLIFTAIQLMFMAPGDP